MQTEMIMWDELSQRAWQVRENAFLYGNTKVGAAILGKNKKVYTGCNIEHKFRSHDIHAEVNAISSMLADGESTMIAILVVAERHKFTPCGSCMDWIIQHGGPDCIVAYQNSQNGEIFRFRAIDLMPHYPM